jgi:hypothetical protein
LSFGRAATISQTRFPTVAVVVLVLDPEFLTTIRENSPIEKRTVLYLILLLPEPDAPIKPTIDCSGTVRSTSCSASILCWPLVKFLLLALSPIAGAVCFVSAQVCDVARDGFGEVKSRDDEFRLREN